MLKKWNVLHDSPELSLLGNKSRHGNSIGFLYIHVCLTKPIG